MEMSDNDTTTPKIIDFTESPTPEHMHKNQERRQRDLGALVHLMCVRSLHECTTVPVKAVVKVPRDLEDGIDCAVDSLTKAGWKVTTLWRFWWFLLPGSWRIAIIVTEFCCFSCSQGRPSLQ